MAEEAASLEQLRSRVANACGALHEFVTDRALVESACESTAALAAVEARLAHAFSHPWLLHAALMHPSFLAASRPTDVQCLLAWIGDAALQSIVTDDLINRFVPAGGGGAQKVKGALSAARSAVLSRAGCARHARALGVDGGALLVGGSVKGGGGLVSDAMLGECFEAIIGAVYVDAGRAAARAAFLRVDPFPVRDLKDLAGEYGL